MFVQVIQGRVSDAAQVREQLDRWATEVAPEAVGWLGNTAGVTDDGTLVALARFESEEAAQQNSDRPQQTAWWQKTASLFIDEPGVPEQHIRGRRHTGRPLAIGLRPGNAGPVE